MSVCVDFPLWAAVGWDWMPVKFRAAGAIAVGAIGMLSAGLALFVPSAAVHALHGHWGAMDARWTAWKALHDMPVSTWLLFRSILTITGISLTSLSLVALYLIFKQRETLAAIALALAMIPGGLSMMEGVARTAPYFSLADVGRFLNPRLDGSVETVFEGPLDDGSSLIFYLNRKFFLVNQNRQKEAPIGISSSDIFLTEDTVLQKWNGTGAIYLIIEHGRV